MVRTTCNVEALELLKSACIRRGNVMTVGLIAEVDWLRKQRNLLSFHNMSLQIVPVYLKEARRFVGLVHRHNKPPQGGLFAVGLVDSENPNQLIGVAIAGRTIS